MEKSIIYHKKKKEIAKIHNKIQRSRRDRLHKLSNEMTNKYDYIFVEDIDLIALSKNNKLKNATKDNGYGEFVKMLEYKAKEKGTVVKRIDRWYPSSKRCHVCGNVIDRLDIGVKEWMCPACRTLLNRDINAAINIKEEGLKKHTVDQPEYAC